MRPAGPARWDLVVKVGGSLGGDGGRLGAIMRTLAAVARRRRVLVVPGGGRFADLVRAEMRRLDLPGARAHEMALLAMDQYAHVLASRAPSAVPVATFAAARRAAARGRLPILLAARWLPGAAGRAAGLERSFRLTSDAIAARVAGRIGARELVLLKSVPGLNHPIAGRRAAGEAARRGLVDPLLARHLPRAAVVRLVDGNRRDLRDDLSARAPGRRRPSAARRGTSGRAPGRAVRGGRPSTGRRARR